MSFGAIIVVPFLVSTVAFGGLMIGVGIHEIVRRHQMKFQEHYLHGHDELCSCPQCQLCAEYGHEVVKIHTAYKLRVEDLRRAHERADHEPPPPAYHVSATMPAAGTDKEGAGSHTAGDTDALPAPPPVRRRHVGTRIYRDWKRKRVDDRARREELDALYAEYFEEARCLHRQYAELVSPQPLHFIRPLKLA